MEYVKKVDDALEGYVQHIPDLVKVCEKYKLPAGRVLGGILFVLTVVGVITQGYNIVCAVMTCVYPMLESIRTLEVQTQIADKKTEDKKTIEKNDRDITRWLSFWTVFGIFQTVEMFFGFVLAFIPYYYFLRIVFFWFLMSPTFNGAENLYITQIEPFLSAHEDDIKEFIEKCKDQATSVQAEALEGAKKAATELNNPENMMKMAAAAQKVQDVVKEDKDSIVVDDQIQLDK